MTDHQIIKDRFTGSETLGIETLGIETLGIETLGAEIRADCCLQVMPQECQDGSCQHGKIPMWNIALNRWEIPPEGPCGEYRMEGQRVRHHRCPEYDQIPA